MPSFFDNIKIIETAIYGKEMRPAISEALTQGHDEALRLDNAFKELEARVNALSGGGGSDDPDDPVKPDDPIPTPSENCGSFADNVSYILENFASTPLGIAGAAERFA